jgi:hypothetical protein
MANTTTNGPQAAAPAPPAARKGKGKKNTDPVDTNKLLEQTMARLERDVAGDKEQEADIGMCFWVHIALEDGVRALGC